MNKLYVIIDRNTIFNYKAFESILKKCKFINYIIFNFSYYNEIINTEQIFKSIIRNCNNLELIEFNFSQISNELIENFGLKFGQKLRSISFVAFR